MKKMPVIQLFFAIMLSYAYDASWAKGAVNSPTVNAPVNCHSYGEGSSSVDGRSELMRDKAIFERFSSCTGSTNIVAQIDDSSQHEIKRGLAFQNMKHMQKMLAMANRRFEARMKNLHEALKIKPNQEEAWNTFVNARRSLMPQLSDLEQAHLASNSSQEYEPKEIKNRIRARMKRMQPPMHKVQEAVNACDNLYSVVNPEQQEILLRLQEHSLDRMKRKNRLWDIPKAIFSGGEIETDVQALSPE